MSVFRCGFYPLFLTRKIFPEKTNKQRSSSQRKSPLILPLMLSLVRHMASSARKPSSDKLVGMLAKLVAQMRNEPSLTEKKTILAGASQLQPLLKEIYSPSKKLGITSKSILGGEFDREEFDANPALKYDSLLKLLQDLAGGQLRGNAARYAAQTFIAKHQEHQELLLDVFDKKLKMGAGASLLSQVVPQAEAMEKPFTVALGESITPTELEKIPSSEVSWYLSRKLDGVRCLCRVTEEKEMTFFTRAGNVINGTESIAKEILGLLGERKGGVVFDGELCTPETQVPIQEGGEENFKSLVSEVKKKSPNFEKVSYHVFDMLSLKDFGRGSSDETLKERLRSLDQLLGGGKPSRSLYSEVDKDSTPSLKDFFFQAGTKNVWAIQQVRIPNDPKWLKSVSALASTGGWEGFMLRKDSIYKGKRSRDLLKLKVYQDDEYVVKSIEIGPISVFQGGKRVVLDLLASVVIEHKGTPVNVGSGFTMEQRQLYKENPALIVGKVITVRYFEETEGDRPSLRFPSLKVVHGDKFPNK